MTEFKPEDIERRSRTEGRSVYLEVLADRVLWNAASKLIQDRAIEQVELRISADFSHTETLEYVCGGQSHRIASFEHKATGMIFQLIPGRRASLDPKTAEESTIPPLLIARTAVTQQVWDTVGGDDERSWTSPELPIEGVSWEACTTWLKKLGSDMRLLREQEWEYACRAGTRSKYFYGESETELADFAWYWDNSDRSTSAVAQKKPNAFGLHDMLGGVWEWCWDEIVVDETPPPELAHVVLRAHRGASWANTAKDCHSSIRGWSVSDDRLDHLGFRIAKTITID